MTPIRRRRPVVGWRAVQEARLRAPWTIFLLSAQVGLSPGCGSAPSVAADRRRLVTP